MTKIKSGTNSFSDNDIYIGDGTNTTSKRILADNGVENKPYLTYNHTTNLWELSHNGTTISDINKLPGGAPYGFENRTDSQISFNDGYREFSIGLKVPATSWNMWSGLDTKITKSTTESLTIPNSVGRHYIYYSAAGALVSSADFPGFNSILVALIYWNGTKAISVSDERHQVTMDWATRSYLHNTVGTRYQTGFALTNILVGVGTVDTNAQITIDGGTVWDEDIQAVIIRSSAPANPFEQELGLTTTPGKIPVIYRSGVGGDWTKDTATNFPMRPWNGTLGNRIGYNLNTGGTWSVADSAINGRYVAVWIVATTSITEPVVSIMGQRVDTSLANAQANNLWESMVLGNLPFQESKVLFRLIIRTDATYANTIKAYIAHIQDLRSVSNLPAGTYVASDHGSLSGRTEANSHPATAISTSTTNFNGILSGNDTDVQLSFDTLDNHNHIHANLSNMQGGSGTDGYYHFTNSEHTWLKDGYTNGKWRETKGGTNQTTYATGDILYASGSNTLTKLSASTDGYILTLSGGIPSWRSTTVSAASIIYINSGAYTNITGGYDGYLMPDFTIDTNELPICLVNSGGTLRDFRINMATAPGSGQSVTFTVRKNNIDTGIAITVSGTNKTGSDTSNFISVIAGDIISIRITTSASATPANIIASLNIIVS